MSKVDQSLSEVFGVDPIYDDTSKTEIMTVQQTEIQPVQIVSDDPDMDEIDVDIAVIRNNLHALIRSGQDAFESVIHIAKAEEKISAFEIGSLYLSNLASINMQLLALHEKKKKIKQTDDSKTKIVNNGGTTNIAFVGTTKDMLQQLKSQGLINKPDPNEDE
ncbi:MAG TPA: hypothetical protein VFM18_10955 [Methanosarcina sp.]|nr:hypothetical protein [Methanosarcina sp.]